MNRRKSTVCKTSKTALGMVALLVAALGARSARADVPAWNRSSSPCGMGTHARVALGWAGTVPWEVVVQEGPSGTLQSSFGVGSLLDPRACPTPNPGSFAAGFAPSIAKVSVDSERYGAAVFEVHQATQGVGPLIYDIGSFANGFFTWHGSQYDTSTVRQYDTGFAPSVASAGGFVLEVHQVGTGSGPLVYRLGNYETGIDSFTWYGPAVQYDTGKNPSVALTRIWDPATSGPNGPVIAVEVHEGDAGALWFRVGRVTGATITWGAAHQYNSGYAPTVAIHGNAVIEAHQSLPTASALWENTGNIDDAPGEASGHIVDWTIAKDHDSYPVGPVQYDTGSSPALAWDETAQVGIELHGDPGGTTAVMSRTFTFTGGTPPPRLPNPPPTTVTGAVAGHDDRARAFLKQAACGHLPPPPGFLSPGVQGNELDDIRAGTTTHFPGQSYSEQALAMIAYDGVCDGTGESRKDRIRLLNAVLGHLTTRGQRLGTTVDKAGLYWAGELDTALKDLIPIIMQYGSLLDQDTLGALVGFVEMSDSGPYTSAYDYVIKSTFPNPPGELDVPETENHLLAIHSTRYLINQVLRESLGNMSPDFDNSTNQMRAFWLTRLQQVMQHDLAEYNSRPYNKYALDSIQNLAEYASDPAIQTAARSVLDYMSAKYAVASSLGRRSSPFRRRASHDGPDFFTQVDEEQCRFALYAGTADLLPGLPAPGAPTFDFPPLCGGNVRQAMGTYRVPPMILALAIDKLNNPFFQVYNLGTNAFQRMDGGIEIYDNEGTFTIAAGGIPTHALNASVFWTTQNDSDDIGLSLPTVLMPNVVYPSGDVRNATNRSQLVRFTGESSLPTNLCVARGFACGSHPVIPPALCSPGSPLCVVNGHWTFLDFATGASDGFYTVVWTANDVDGQPVGFLEAVPASWFNYKFTAFQSMVLGLNGDGSGAAQTVGNGTVPTLAISNYKSVRGGNVTGALSYMPSMVAMFARTYPIAGVSWTGVAPLDQNTMSWPLAQGIVSSVGYTGTTSVSVKGYGTCTWDLSNAGFPSRSGCDAPAVDFPPPPGPSPSPPPPPPQNCVAWAMCGNGAGVHCDLQNETLELFRAEALNTPIATSTPVAGAPAMYLYDPGAPASLFTESYVVCAISAARVKTCTPTSPNPLTLELDPSSCTPPSSGGGGAPPGTGGTGGGGGKPCGGKVCLE